MEENYLSKFFYYKMKRLTIPQYYFKSIFLLSYVLGI